MCALGSDERSDYVSGSRRAYHSSGFHTSSKADHVREVHARGPLGGLRSLALGAVVGRRYRVGDKIASDAMGEVWRAEHMHLGLRVALKVLRREVRANPEVMARFSREALL